MIQRIISAFAMGRLLCSCTILLLLVSNSHAADWTKDADCLGAWTFDELTGDIVDQCGTFNGDMNEDPPARVNGKFFGGVDFTGDIIRFGDVPYLDGKKKFTVSIWLKTSKDLDRSEANIWRKDNAFSFQDAVNRQRVILFTPGREDHNISKDNYPTDFYILTDNEWHMYSFTYNGQVQTAYRDCVAVGKTYKNSGVVNNSAADLVLGKKPPEVRGPSGAYRGVVDDFIMLDRVFNKDECVDLMSHGIDGKAGILPVIANIQGGADGIKLQNVRIGGMIEQIK